MKRPVRPILSRWADRLRRLDAPSVARGDLLLTTRALIFAGLTGFLAVLTVATGFSLITGTMYGFALVAIILGAFAPPSEVVRLACAAIAAFCGGVVAFLFSLTFEVSISGGQPIGEGSARELLAVLGAAVVALLSSLLLAGRATGAARVERAAASRIAASRHAELLEAASSSPPLWTIRSASLALATALLVAGSLRRWRVPGRRT